MIDDQVYNHFARALTEQISSRAKGLDEESARIVNVRPQEHILSGFLTSRSAAHPPVASPGPDEDIDDLPRDAAFELTSIGLEWLADQEALSRTESLTAWLSANLYVRCTPTFDEQNRLSSWRREQVAAGSPPQKSKPVLPVWRRLEMSEFSVEISIKDLLKDKRQKIDISPFLQPPANVLPQDIYTARRPIHLTEPVLQRTIISWRAPTYAYTAFYPVLEGIRRRPSHQCAHRAPPHPRRRSHRE